METEIYENMFAVEESHWWYRARREIIFYWIDQVAKTHPCPRFLDIGCGTGYNLYTLREMGYQFITGADIFYSALKYSKARGIRNLVCSNGENLPLAHGSYDLILALDVVEHIKDDFRILKEVNRVLKIGGKFIIFVPAFHFLWSLEDEVSHHYRRYSKKELITKVRQAGFEIQKITYANTLLFPLVALGRLILRIFRPFFKISSESEMNPKWMNSILYRLFLAERFFLRFVNFPFGVSILCVCKKVYEHN